ncbi:class I SAM-dependent methyltransferase [Paenibacillus aurantius]|uniref:Class I SAM-dependent methyltransferase n=1 Tax=Paenibacillus aurantius TaxID=2918900 RepID=A0AA96LBB9_9BACL|nr:class I SAM-dependent methyltransferase [Paenibacillus aurantius]WNQ09170.1 class I SAM-dependent methyltransferase [Paenibacillus aurantius]
MIVTTSYNPSETIVGRSRQWAAELGAQWVPRRRLSIRQLRERYATAGILLQTERQLQYYPEGEDFLYFHPSMAHVRIKRLERGEPDPMLELSGARPGDAILDCTAGLASDALVFSYAAGASGKVTALESERVLALLLREGLQAYPTDLAPLEEAMRRIEIRHAEHLSYLRSQPDDSCDIVYFDPMFRLPLEDSSAISPLRQAANPHPLSPEAVKEAVRVARRRVVLKDHRDSPEFERLGFYRPKRTRTKITYGVIDCGTSS